LKKDDSRQADRDTASRLLEEITRDDFVMDRGGSYFHGAHIQRRIFNALRLARADERRRGFDTPYIMRDIAVAKGAPAVIAKHPGARPLHYAITVEGVRAQAYRYCHDNIFVISDDARIEIQQVLEEFVVRVDGEPVVICGPPQRFPTEIAALRAGIERMRNKDKTGF
jgi:hypothetical protein